MKDAKEATEGPTDNEREPDDRDPESPTPDESGAASSEDQHATKADAAGETDEAEPNEETAARAAAADGDDTASRSKSPDGEATEADGSTGKKVQDEKAADAKESKSFWLWAAGIALILVIELFIYGHNGHIEVCVGLEGVTDWTLKDKPKNPENFRKAPMCAERMNLGMYSGTQEAAESALDEACRRATMMNRKALPGCIRREGKWTRQVLKEQVFPWDERLYKRLLWLE